jgi:hypothetical protein
VRLNEKKETIRKDMNKY